MILMDIWYSPVQRSQHVGGCTFSVAIYTRNVIGIPSVFFPLEAHDEYAARVYLTP